MQTEGFLLKGILAVAAFLAVTAAIIASAPYLAVVLIIFFIAKMYGEDEETISNKDDQ